MHYTTRATCPWLDRTYNVGKHGVGAMLSCLSVTFFGAPERACGRHRTHLSLQVFSNSPHVRLHVIKTHFVISFFFYHRACGVFGNLPQDKFGLLWASVRQRRMPVKDVTQPTSALITLRSSNNKYFLDVVLGGAGPAKITNLKYFHFYV